MSGDLLTATLWSWFAAHESHQRLSQSTAGVISHPGLSYGLFHAVAQAVYSYGVPRQVKFPGVHMDIGHMRLLSWAKDNDSAKWVHFNRLSGQHMSALEHAVPERFFNDPSQCNPTGTSSPTAGLPECPQGISAVKALALAGSQGQKIYTITQKVYNDNPGIVASQLSAHSAATRAQVQQALDQGHEVSIHERPINVSGWRGAGFVVIDPRTGAGGYVIEGGSNGGILFFFALIFIVLASFATTITAFAVALIFLIGFSVMALSRLGVLPGDACKAGASLVIGTIFTNVAANILQRLGAAADPLSRFILNSNTARGVGGAAGYFYFSDALCWQVEE